ncbi:MAG: hypothetical protein HY850_04630 [Betaproteobacteria bacterium]|nr:hypothetical protein [Betaproteobacteria bacterium]
MEASHRTLAPPKQGSSDRAFGWVMAVFFGLIGLWPLLSAQATRDWALGLAAAFALAALLAPRRLAPLNRAWMQLGLLLHKITNPIVLGVAFYLVIAPIGLLMRLAGHDPLRLKRDDSAASYWIARQPPGPPPASFPRQF